MLVISLVLTACGYRRSDLPAPSEEFLAQPDFPLFPDNYEHRLGPSDLVTVSVYRAPEFSGDFRVDASGQIMVPLIGLVPTQGMTTVELATDLQHRLEEQYLVNPDVSVSLKESNSQRLTVDGSVRNPGIYALGGRTTLMEAVARAGGTTGGANLRRVVVFRQINGERMVAAFDLQAIREAQVEDPAVYASDIIIVDGNQTRQALRDAISTIPIIALFRPFIY